MRPNSRSTWCLLGLVFWAAAFFAHTWPGDAEENQYIRFFMARSVVDHASLSIDPVLKEYRTDNNDKAVYEGKGYCDKSIGHPALGTLGYAMVRVFGVELAPHNWLYLLTLLVNVLTHVLGVYLFLRGCRALGASEALSLSLAAVYGLATPALLYGSLFFGHQVALTASVGALTLLLEWERSAKAAESARRVMLGAGFFTAMTVAVEYQALLVGLCLSAYCLSLTRNRNDLLFFVLGALPWVVLVLGHNALVFDHPLATGYSYKFGGAGITAAPALEGTMHGFRWPSISQLNQILFGALRGLFYFSPVLLMGALGWAKSGWRSTRAGFWWCGTALVLGHTLLMASYADWTGGYTAGPRFMLPLIPILVWGLIPLIQDGAEVWRRRWSIAVTALAILSLMLEVALVGTFPFHETEFSNPIYQLSLPLVLDGYLAPNWGHWLGLGSTMALCLFLTPFVLLGLYAARAFGGLKQRLWPLWVALIWALSAGLMLAVAPPDLSPSQTLKRADALQAMGYTDAAKTIRANQRRRQGSQRR